MQQIKASVWPHGHSQEFGGPVDVAIGVKCQPVVLRTWDMKDKPQFRIEQPDPDSNLTLIRIAFGYDTSIDKWHKGNVYRKQNIRRQVETEQGPTDIDPGGVIVVAIKGRYTNQLAHPLPIGKYMGTCEEGGGWVLFTLQARTLVRQNVTQKKNILTPGDFEFQETLNGVTPSPNKIIVP